MNPTNSVADSYFKCNLFRYTFSMSFGKWLIQKRNAARLTQVQLAKRVGISANYISALERDEPNARDGSPRRPRIDKVERLAKALGCPLDEARLAAGYAPKTITRKPETIPELVAALEQLGIEAPQPFGGYPKDDDGEGYREVVERIWLDIDMVTKRLTKGRDRPIIQNLELSDFDIEAEIDKRKSG